MRMLGCAERVGPGGKKCACCYPPPSFFKLMRRRAKRRERQAWRRETRGYTEQASTDQEDR